MGPMSRNPKNGAGERWRDLMEQLAEEIERIQAHQEDARTFDFEPSLRTDMSGLASNKGQTQALNKGETQALNKGETQAGAGEEDATKLTGGWDLAPAQSGVAARTPSGRGRLALQSDQQVAPRTGASPVVAVHDASLASDSHQCEADAAQTDSSTRKRRVTVADTSDVVFTPQESPQQTSLKRTSLPPRRQSSISSSLASVASLFSSPAEERVEASDSVSVKSISMVDPDTSGLRDPTVFTSMDEEGGNALTFQLLKDWETICGELRISSYNGSPSKRPVFYTGFGDLSPTRLRCSHEFSGAKDCCSISKFMISPVSTKRIVWNMMSIILLFIDTLMVPLHLFNLEENELSKTMFWVSLFFWSFDIPMSFLTGTYFEGKLEMRPGFIAKQYCRGWLSFDVFALLPDYVFLIVSSSNDSTLARSVKVFKTLRMIRILRILRLLKFRGSFGWLMERINNEYTASCANLVGIIIGIAMINHYVACVWYMVSSNYREEWLVILEDSKTSLIYIYLTSFHWALSQFHGTMDVHPSTVPGRIYGICVLFFGLVTSSIFISSVTNVLAQLQRLHFETFRRHRMLLRYLIDNHVSAELATRIKRYAKQVANANRTRATDVTLINDLPEGMQCELVVEVHRPALDSHTLFHQLATNSDALKIVLCSKAIGKARLLPGEVLFNADQGECMSMFYIRVGVLEYFPEGDNVNEEVSTQNNSQSQQDGMDMSREGSRQFPALSTLASPWNLRKTMTSGARRLSTLGDVSSPNKAVVKEKVEQGQCICEMCLWTKWSHKGDAVARGSCDVFTIDAAGFVHTFKNGRFKREARITVEYAKRYLHWLNGLEERQVHDVTAPTGVNFL